MTSSKTFEKEFFEEWAVDYDKKRNKSFLKKSKTMMKVVVEKYLNKNENFLEIGLGTGENFGLVKPHFHQTYGLDISEGMVRATHVKIEEGNLLVADACNLGLKTGMFDFIICQDVLEHVPDQQKTIAGICRILEKGGIAVITTPNPIWAPVLYIAEKIKLKVEEGEHEFVFLEKIVRKVLQKMDGYSIIDTKPFMMIPVSVPFENSIESLTKYKKLAKLGFSQMCIIKRGG
jgi:ubiquinone/menaquinone biosynthesis C-methylase UbiE